MKEWQPRLNNSADAKEFRRLDRIIAEGRAIIQKGESAIQENESAIAKITRDIVPRAHEIGAKAKDALELIAYGDTKRWLTKRFGSPSTGYGYMKLADEAVWQKVSKELDSPKGCTLRRALDLAVENPRPKQADTTDPKDVVIDRLKRWVEGWPAWRARRMKDSPEFIERLERTTKKLNLRLKRTMPKVKRPATSPQKIDPRAGQIINRRALVQLLEALNPGLAGVALADFTAQSTKFIFRDGEVITYNGDIACRQKISLELTGAVDAKALLDVLRNSNEREIAVRVEKGKLILSGTATVRLPLDEIESSIDAEVEQPGEWIDIGPEFIDAIARAIPFVRDDETKFILTCVHIEPGFVEACNNREVFRVMVPTGVTERILLRGRSFLPMTKMGLVRMSVTDKRIHFQNRTGFSCSYEKFKEPYPDLKSMFKVRGHLCALPKDLVSICQRSATLLGDKTDWITVAMQKNKMILKADGKYGQFEESAPIEYDGPAFEFIIDPPILQRIADNYPFVEIAENILKAEGENWMHIVRLGHLGQEKEEAA